MPLNRSLAHARGSAVRNYLPATSRTPGDGLAMVTMPNLFLVAFIVARHPRRSLEASARGFDPPPLARFGAAAIAGAQAGPSGRLALHG